VSVAEIVPKAAAGTLKGRRAEKGRAETLETIRAGCLAYVKIRFLRAPQWKERLHADAGQAAMELIDAELADAMDAAREAGWQGEVQGEPHIFVLPAEHDFQFGFAWKGARTTVLAPRALPWMTPQHVAPC